MNEWNIEVGFPAVITPTQPNQAYDDFIASVIRNKEQLKSLLLEHGALFFRGFPVASPENFANIIESFGLGQFVNYIGGDSPRDKVKEKVYTSTEAPPSLFIPLHQEMSFVKNYPKQIYFYCETASPTGGATIIGDARRIYADMDPAIRETFAEKGLTYVSRYHGNHTFMRLLNKFQRSHKSWQEVFESSDKREVEQRCERGNFEWKWLPNNWLEVRQTCPAVLDHPQTNDTVWFNQAHLYDFNPRLLGWLNYFGANLLYLKPQTRLHEVTYADGSPIPRKVLYHIFDVLNKNTINYPWQKGDVMILDNVLSMHGRATFKGKRRVLTALTA